jgi:hypothetical protein
MRVAVFALLLVGCSSVAAQQPGEDQLLPNNFGVGTFVPAEGEYLKLEARSNGATREVPPRGVIDPTPQRTSTSTCLRVPGVRLA